MHPANAPGAQRPIGKETSDQEQKGISSQEIVRERVDLSDCDDDADEPDDRQTDADHGRGNREDMNANIFFEMVSLI